MALSLSPAIDHPDEPSGKRSYTPALVTLGILYFMMGFITCLNDSLVPFFKSEFKLSYSQSSLVQFYFFLTYALVSIPGGKLIEVIGYKNGMVAGFFISSAGAFSFYPASVFHEYPVFLAALFILAIGIVLLQVSANPYITMLGPRKTASARLTLIQAMGSIGTTLAPLFGSMVILSEINHQGGSSESVRIPYIGIGIILAVIAIIILKLNLPKIRTAGEKAVSRSRSVFSFSHLNYGIIGIFLYVGAEVSIGTFLTNYIADNLHTNPSDSNRLVSYYWGAMLVGRLLGFVALRKIKPNNMLALLSLFALLLILFSLSNHGNAAVWSLIGVGLCNSIMFAVIFSLSIEGLDAYAATASGLLSTAIVGGAIISFLVGYAKDMYSWKVAFLIPALCYLYLFFLGLSRRRRVNVISNVNAGV